MRLHELSGGSSMKGKKVREKHLPLSRKEVIMIRWKVEREQRKISIFHSQPQVSEFAPLLKIVDDSFAVHCEAEKLIKETTTRCRFLSKLMKQKTELNRIVLWSCSCPCTHIFKRRHPIVHYSRSLSPPNNFHVALCEQVSSANDYTLIFEVSKARQKNIEQDN